MFIDAKTKEIVRNFLETSKADSSRLDQEIAKFLNEASSEAVASEGRRHRHRRPAREMTSMRVTI